MIATDIALKKNEWVRFQVSDRRVLEGFVQEVSADGLRILVGKAPWSYENQWHNLHDITVLDHQAINAPV